RTVLLDCKNRSVKFPVPHARGQALKARASGINQATLVWLLQHRYAQRKAIEGEGRGASAGYSRARRLMEEWLEWLASCLEERVEERLEEQSALKSALQAAL